MDPLQAANEPREAARRRSRSAHQSRQTARGDGAERLPLLLTVDDVATLLRTTGPAVYAMVARRQLPGVTRLGRRVLFRSDDLLRWFDQNRAPSPKE